MLKDKFAFIDEATKTAIRKRTGRAPDARGDKNTADALLFSPIRD